MVTRALINSIKDSSTLFTPFDRADAEARFLAAMRAALPDWDYQSDTILRRSFPTIAEQMSVGYGIQVEGMKQTSAVWANGANLEAIGISRGRPKAVGENEENYRLAVTTAREPSAPVTEDRIVSEARRFNSDLVEVVTDINHNTRNVSVWAAKADRAALSAAEMTALETHFAADGNHLAGTTISVHGWTEIAYTVTLVVYHNPLQSDAAAVMERVMTSVSDYLSAAEVLGGSIYRAGISKAAALVEGVLNVERTSPDEDFAPPWVVLSRAGSDTTGEGAWIELRVTPDTSGADVGTGPIASAIVRLGGAAWTAVPTAAVFPSGKGGMLTVVLGTGQRSQEVASLTVDAGGSGYRSGPDAVTGFCPYYQASEVNVEVRGLAL